LFRSACSQRWQRHTLLQFLACALAEANCKCVWLLALAYANSYSILFSSLFDFSLTSNDFFTFSLISLITFSLGILINKFLKSLSEIFGIAAPVLNIEI